jgi:hypothetical protein
MNLITKLAVSAALLSAAAVSHAQLVVPTPPPTLPTDGSMAASTGNGALLIQAFDPLTGASLTEYTGLNFNGFQNAAVSATGGTFDFHILGGASLWNSTFGSDTNPISFVVVSASNTPGSLASVMTTTNSPPATLRNSIVSNGAAKFNTTVGTLTSGFPSTPLQAVGVNPAQTLATTDNGWGQVQALGFNLGGTMANLAGTVGGTGVAFEEFTMSSNSLGANSVITKYGNTNGLDTWSIAANGDVTFTVPGGAAPVPLPAAIWLLGSGLLGFAGIGRRRAAAALA